MLRDISFDIIIFILAEILQAHFQQISIFAVYFLLSVLAIGHSCESLSQNLELAILLNPTENLSNH